MSKQKITISSNTSQNTVLSLIAYIGIGCIAVSLLLTLILANNSSLSNAFQAVGECIAYVLSIILAFNWVKSHKHVAWVVCYVVFVVTIIVLFILNVI
ncbi:MAG: hypothetical protein E7379_01595 [Clostridiales bacterium]|nr:hypothetical protein [Clostridiales bacterium]